MEEKLKYEICKSNLKWDDFILKSENKNIYSISTFLNDTEFKSEKVFIKKNDEVLSSFNIYIKNKKICEGDRIYSPINFKFFEKKNISSIYYKKHNIIKLFVSYITKKFTEGLFAFDCSTQDLRPFFWYNFNAQKEIFSIKEVRYTSILNIDYNFKKLDIDELINSKMFEKFSRSIKQQIKSSKNYDFEIKESVNLDTAFSILKKTFKNQNKKIDFDVTKYKKIYKKLIDEKKLKMYVVERSQKIISFCIFGIIKDYAVYLNGGRDGNLNEDYSLTYCLAMSAVKLSILGIKKIDLEGLNSPKRAFWKQGFGGTLTPYYKLSMKNS